MRNPKFHQTLSAMAETHDRKNHDYARDDNPYSNFEHVANATGQSVDMVFMTMIAVKQARLVELLGGKEPNNESIEDSILDLAVYTALWHSYRQADDPTLGATDWYRNLMTERELLELERAATGGTDE